jgi:hypothetical protein
VRSGARTSDAIGSGAPAFGGATVFGNDTKNGSTVADHGSVYVHLLAVARTLILGFGKLRRSQPSNLNS